MAEALRRRAIGKMLLAGALRRRAIGKMLLAGVPCGETMRQHREAAAGREQHREAAAGRGDRKNGLVVSQCLGKLCQRLLCLLRLWCLAVPCAGALHKVHAFAHYGIHKNHYRLVELFACSFGLCKGIENGLHIVTVCLNHVPAKGLPFGFEVSKFCNLLCGAVYLLVVTVC